MPSSPLSASSRRSSDWGVTARLLRPAGPVEVPFQVTSGPSPAELRQMSMGSMPMVYGLRLANGWRLQAYLSPGRPGRDTLHLAFTDQRNGPVTVPDLPTVTAGHGGPARALQVLRLGFGIPTRNQFYAVGTFAAGRWDFHVTAHDPDGHRLDAGFALTVQRA